jgi:hypothetical protein
LFVIAGSRKSPLYFYPMSCLAAYLQEQAEGAHVMQAVSLSSSGAVALSSLLWREEKSRAQLEHVRGHQFQFVKKG